MTTVVYSNNELYADSQITSVNEFIQSNHFPKMKSVMSVGLENRHHGKTKVLYNGTFYISYAGSMALIKDLLVNFEHVENETQMLQAALATAKAYEDFRNSNSVNLSCRVLLLNKDENKLYGFMVATIGNDHGLYGIDATSKWKLDYDEVYWLGSGSGFKEVQELALQGKPDEALEKASELDFATGGTCMNSKELDSSTFDYAHSLNVIKEAVAHDQSLCAEDLALDSIIAVGTKIEAINVEEEIRKLSESVEEDKTSH